jgi:Flp pilus assembly CpaE family ATPase
VGDLPVAGAALRRRRGASVAAGPRFDRLNGPLVAVCGLVGGAGASTLALALGRHAATQSSAPVLLTETAPERGGLAVLTSRASPLCLRELAAQLAAGHQPAEAFVELERGLRLVAAPPRVAAPGKPGDLGGLLAQARAAHGLVVVDCGPPSSEQASVLRDATHIVWALPATSAAVRRAQVQLAAGVLLRPGRAPEIMVASALQPPARGAARELRRLSDQRCERLALVPHSPRLAGGDLDGLDDLADAVAAIAGLLREAR